MEISKALCLLVCGTLLGSGSVFGISKFPLDGTLTSIEAEAPQNPYREDKTYAYSKTTSFPRLVYNSWLKPTYSDKMLAIANTSEAKKRGILISELVIPSQNFDKKATYDLLLRKHYQCTGDATESCNLKMSVRCYGKDAEGKWIKTFESIKNSKGKTGDLAQFENEFHISAEKCPHGIHVAMEGSIIPRQSSYAFKSVDISIKPNKG